jgi:hypothetical protein
MTLPVKSLIGLISSNSSRETLVHEPREGIELKLDQVGDLELLVADTSTLRSILAYEIATRGVRARVEDSADSMKHRSLTEVEGKERPRSQKE